MGKSKTSGGSKRENTLAKNPIPLLRGGEMKWGLIYLRESLNQNMNFGPFYVILSNNSVH